MKSLFERKVRFLLLALAAGVLTNLFLLFYLTSSSFAQEKPASPSRRSTEFSAANSQFSTGSNVAGKTSVSKDSAVAADSTDKDGVDQIEKRDEWFYKQRAFPLRHIPAGARLKAFQHLQRMMEAEGKLVRRSDGTYAAVTPQAGSVSSPAWTPIGPAPTTGGFFSPVTGRVTTIAVDPSDSTGNTILIGGAQGGIWRTTNAGLTWTAVGDQNPSLAMGSIAFANPASPGGPGVVYAGTGEQASVGFDVYYGAGVLKSTDGGQTWTQTCTVAGPTCPFIGPYSDFTFGFFSDGGAHISYIAVSPSNPNLVLVGAQIPQATAGLPGLTDGGVYCSDDGGATWANLLGGNMSTFVGFANPTTAYVALGGILGSTSGGNPNGIYKSTNADGKGSAGTLAPKCSNITFSNLTMNGIGGFPASSIGRIDLGIAPGDATGKTVYASIADASINPLTGRSRASRSNLGVFKTLDGGNTWTNTNAPDICAPQCWYDNVVKVDPANSNVVFFGGGARILLSSSSIRFEWVIRSTDSGTTWNAAIPTSPGGDPTLPHVDEHAMAFVRAGPAVRLYLGNDGGVWRTDDAEASTVTWTNLNNFPLQLTQFYPSLSIHPSNPSLGFAGAQDNGSQNFTGKPLSPTDDWTDNRTCGDGGWTLIDPVTPSSVYVLCQLISVRKSLTNGTPGSFQRATNGIILTDPVNFIAPMTIDPANPNRLYFGTSKVYQTVDGANSWLPISGDLSPNPNPLLPPAPIVALAVGGGSNGNVVYAGTSDGLLFHSSDVAPGSATFSSVPGQTQLPPRHPTQIVVDPFDLTGNTVYVTYSGFSGTSADQTGHIFKTLDGGANWVDVSCTRVGDCGQPNLTDLPNIPVNDLVIDPDIPGTLYAATDLGVFTTNDGGAIWTSLNNSLPNVAILSLRLHEPSRTLRAATHGRSGWDLALSNFLFTGPHITDISPTSGNVGDPQDSLAVNGGGFTCNSKIVFALNGTTDTLTPTFCSAGQLVTVIPGSDLQAPGDAQVTVTDPGPPAANSNKITFTVLALPPTVTSISPTSTPVQTPSPAISVNITVTGANFVPSSTVVFNPLFLGAGGRLNLATTFDSSTSLTATIPANLLGPFGSTNDIGVTTPPPGGGSSQLISAFHVIAPAPPNDNFANAIDLASATLADIQDSSNATTEASDPTPPCGQLISLTTSQLAFGRSNTIWYKFTPPSNGTANLDTTGSSYDTWLSVWTGASQAGLTAVPNACSGSISRTVALPAQLRNINLQGGTTYYIMVGSVGPTSGTSFLLAGPIVPNPIAFGGKTVFNFSFTPAPDFSITSSGTTTQTVTAGQTATFTNAISISPQNGFASQVNLSCSLPPAASAAHCAVNPNTFATGSGTATVTVTTTARGLAPLSFPIVRFHLRPQVVPLLLLAMLLAILLPRLARGRPQRLTAALPLCVILVFLTLQAIGCGGGSAQPPPPPTGTPAGTYAVTVTGTSGTLTHTTTLTLTVN